MLKKFKSFLFENKTTRQTIAKNTLWLFSGTAGGRVIRIVVTIMAARILGAEQWGVFAYATTLAAFFSIFSDIGINAILTREVAKNHAAKDRYLSTAFYLKIALIAASTGLILFIAPFFIKIAGVQEILPFIALLFVFDGLRGFALALNRAFELMEREAAVELITNVAITTLGVTVLLVSPTPQSLAMAYAGGAGIGALVALWTLRGHFRHVLTRFTARLVRPMVASAWPFAILGFLGGIMTSTDVIMLGWIRSAVDVGLYSAALRIVQMLYMFPALVSSAMLPVFSRLAKDESRDKMSSLFSTTASLLMLVALPITLGGIILSRHLIDAVFGAQYAGSVVALQILFLTILIYYPLSLAGNVIFAYDKQKYFIGFAALGALGNVILNAILIPIFGINGAAMSTVGAQALAYFFVWRKLRGIVRFSVLPNIKRAVVASAAMAVFTFALDWAGINVFLNIALSMGVYLALLAALKEPLLKEAKSVFA